MKKLMIIGAALLMTAAAYGQGQFTFNTRDPNSTPNNNVQFKLPNGDPATGADLFVEVGTVGADGLFGTSLGTLPLNRTGTFAGYTSPFAAVYNAPTGTTVIGYRAYQGTDWTSSQTRTDLIKVTQQFDATGNPVNIALPADAITPPPELVLGVQNLQLVTIPEPTTLALGLLGLGALLAIRRRN
jgi:hypothetical protein